MSFEFVAQQIIAVFLLAIELTLSGFLLKRSDSAAQRYVFNPWRFVLVVGVLVQLAIVFSFLLGFENLPLATVLAAGCILSLFHPVCAVAFFLGLLLLRPWEYMSQNPLMIYMPRGIALLSLFSLGLYIFRMRRPAIVWSSYLSLFFVFLAWLVVSSVFAPDVAASLNYIVEKFFPVVVITLLIINSVDDQDSIAALVASFVLSVLGVMALALTFVYGYNGDGDVNRLLLTGLLGNSNDLASLIAIATPIVIFRYVLRARSAAVLLFGFSSSAVLFFSLWATQSRGAMLGIAFCGVVYLLISSGGRSRKFMAAAVVILVPALLYMAMNRASGDMSMSSSARWNYVVTGFSMLKSSPIYGVGVGNYPLFYENFTPVFHEWGERTAHSSWVLVMAEAGLVGLLAFVLLMISAIRRAWSVRTLAPEYLLSAVAYGVAMSFLSHTYLFIPYILCCVLVVANRVNSGPIQSEESLHSPTFASAYS